MSQPSPLPSTPVPQPTHIPAGTFGGLAAVSSYIFNYLAPLIGIGLTSGIVSSLLTAWISPRIQHRYWVRQQRFDSRISNLKELHRLASQIQQIHSDKEKYDVHDSKYLELVNAWMATTDQTNYLFSKRAVGKIHELNDAVRVILFRHYSDEPKGEKESELDWYAVLDKFMIARKECFEALYQDLGLEQ